MIRRTSPPTVLTHRLDSDQSRPATTTIQPSTTEPPYALHHPHRSTRPFQRHIRVTRNQTRRLCPSEKSRPSNITHQQRLTTSTTLSIQPMCRTSAKSTWWYSDHKNKTTTTTALNGLITAGRLNWVTEYITIFGWPLIRYWQQQRSIRPRPEEQCYFFWTQEQQSTSSLQTTTPNTAQLEQQNS